MKVPINLKLDNGVIVLELDNMCYLQLRLVAQSLNQQRDLSVPFEDSGSENCLDQVIKVTGSPFSCRQVQ